MVATSAGQQHCPVLATCVAMLGPLPPQTRIDLLGHLWYPHTQMSSTASMPATSGVRETAQLSRRMGVLHAIHAVCVL